MAHSPGDTDAVEEEEEVSLPPPVYQGWVYSKEDGLRLGSRCSGNTWSRRWGVVRPGRFDVYEKEEDAGGRGTKGKPGLVTLHLAQCRVERVEVRDGRLRQVCMPKEPCKRALCHSKGTF